MRLCGELRVGSKAKLALQLCHWAGRCSLPASHSTARSCNALQQSWPTLPAQSTRLTMLNPASLWLLALQDGVKWTGVTVAFTVKEMDAGPVLAQQKVAVDPDIQAPQLLTQLFQLGTELLLSNLDLVWAEVAAQTAVQQDGSQATHAAKIGREEAALDFGSSSAQALHDRVRAFAGWPGTTASFELLDPEQSGGSGNNGEQLELKIVRTRVAPAAAWAAGSSSGGAAAQRQVHVSKEGMFVQCGDGSVLELVEVQAPGKKAVAARDFANGLRGRVLAWQERAVTVATAAS